FLIFLYELYKQKTSKDVIDVIEENFTNNEFKFKDSDFEKITKNLYFNSICANFENKEKDISWEVKRFVANKLINHESISEDIHQKKMRDVLTEYKKYVETQQQIK